MNTKLLFFFKLDVPRKWKIYKNIKKKNMLAISWEQCYCNKLQNQCCKHQKTFKTRYPPSSSSSIIQKVAHKPQKKNSKPNTHLIQVAYYTTINT